MFIYPFADLKSPYTSVI